MKRRETIYEELRRVLSKHGITEETPIVVAVSGGVDSGVLAAAVSHIGLCRVALGHVEHGIRSAVEGASDRATVTTLAEMLHLPLLIRRIEGGAIEDRAHREGASIEAVARNERYGKLREIATDWAARSGTTGGIVLTGHHRDDVGESFLMHLLSGRSALESVTIPERSLIQGTTVLRPLLNAPRSVIEAFAEYHGIPWRYDPTNGDESYLRNFVRHAVLPTVRRRYPGVERALSGFALEVGALREGVAELLPATAWGEAFETKSGGTAWRIDRSRFLGLPGIAQSLVFRRAVQRVSRSERLSFGATADHLGALIRGAPFYLGDVEIVPSVESIEVYPRIVRSLESGYLLDVPQGSFLKIGGVAGPVVRRDGVAAPVSVRFAPLTPPIVARGVQKGDRMALNGVERRIRDVVSPGRRHGTSTPLILIEDFSGVAVVLWSVSEWITRDGVETAAGYEDDRTSIVVQIEV